MELLRKGGETACKFERVGSPFIYDTKNERLVSVPMQLMSPY